jgi:hypothetical protein
MSYLIIGWDGEKTVHKKIGEAADVLLDCVCRDGTPVETLVKNNFSWANTPTLDDLRQAIMNDPKHALLGTEYKLHELSEPAAILLNMMHDAGIPAEAIIMPSLGEK